MSSSHRADASREIVICKKEEMICPPAAGPDHPKVHRLSETDQQRYPVCLLLFYKRGPRNLQVQRLKSSLSKAISIFYPLTGRLVERCTHQSSEDAACHDLKVKSGRMDVSCLDQGFYFAEAWTSNSCSLDAYMPDFTPNPHMDQLRLPNVAILACQITHFSCGGACLSLQVHHGVADGISICANFMNCWLEVHTTESSTLAPYIGEAPLETMYKPKGGRASSDVIMTDEVYEMYYKSAASFGRGMTSKVFHLTPEFINGLKREAKAEGGGAGREGSDYSTFECVLAYMWRQVTVARGVGEEELEVSMGYPVDGRRRLEPPLPPTYFGNCVFKTHASSKACDLVKKPLWYAAHLLRQATCKVTDEHIRAVLHRSSLDPVPMSGGRHLPTDLWCAPLGEDLP